MADIGDCYRWHLDELPAEVVVPSGSGESAVALAMAYPGTHIIARYDGSNPATRWCPEGPLNALVRLLCTVEGAPE